MTETTYWLSFANDHEFGGVVVVDLCHDEIGNEGPFMAALYKTMDLGIDPGTHYEVQGQRLPPGEIPDAYKNRLLLDKTELDRLMRSGRQALS
jgi:hypothetical protein